MKEIEEKGIEASKNDPSIYTGLCGIALLHYKMNGERGKVNDKVFELIRMAENPNRHRITFLCGMAGPLSILYKVKRRRIASIATLKYVISRLHVFVEFLGMYLTSTVGRGGIKYLTPRECTYFFPARRRRKGKKF